MNVQKIIVISGLPGSGKSTVAEAIAKKLQSPLLSVDPVESSILKSGIARSFESGLVAYIVVRTLASEQLKLGMSVIIDAVNPVKEAREMWHELKEKHNAKLFINECLLDEQVHKQRLHDRVRNMHGIPEVTWEDVEKRKKEYIPWKEKRLILDTAQSQEKNLQEVLDYIEAL